MIEKLLCLMLKYDSSIVGTPERVEFGSKLDKEGSKLSERDFWKVVCSYEASKRGK